MKIAFICKRRYTGSDVVSDRFGRLYQIPFQLARLGHEVRGYCLDYHEPGRGEWQHDAGPGSLSWESRSLGYLRLPAMLAYPWVLLRRLRRFAPDLLMGASDIPHVALAGWLARRLGLPYAIDLYDNFESFSLARVPGFTEAYRRTIRGAGFVTVVSEPLRRLVEEDYASLAPAVVMTNGIDPLVFRPSDKRLARQALGLPADARLVGTAGGLSASKGVGPLYEAWQLLAATHPDIHLVLAGPTGRDCPRPRGDRVHYLGKLPHAQVAGLFNALDVGVVTLVDSAFGRFCYPQKLQEMLACGLPVVATSVGAMPELLAGSPQLLYPSGDPQALAAAVIRQLANPVMPAAPARAWEHLVAGIEPGLLRLAGR